MVCRLWSKIASLGNFSSSSKVRGMVVVEKESSSVDRFFHFTTTGIHFEAWNDPQRWQTAREKIETEEGPPRKITFDFIFKPLKFQSVGR